MRPVAHRKTAQTLPGKWGGSEPLPSAVPRSGVYASLWEVDPEEIVTLLRGGRAMLVLDTRDGGHPIVRLEVVR